MDHLWQLLTNGNVFLLGFLTWILFQVGRAVSENSSTSHIWAKRSGLVAFIGFTGLSLASAQIPSEIELIVITLRGLLTGWLVTSICLIGLPALLWLARQGRAQQLIFLKAVESRRQKREEQRRLRGEATELKRLQRELDRSAPEREQTQREAMAMAEMEQQQKQQAQKRRDDVRSHLELLYTLFASKIKTRFTMQMFGDFMKKYLGDNRSPDDVEERGRQLQMILEQHDQAVDPPLKTSTLQDLTSWFVAEQQRLDSLPLDDMLKDEFRAILHERYAELTQRFLQKLEP